MKKFSFLMWGMAFMAALTFTACSSSSDDDGPAAGGPVSPDNMKFSALTGVVTDGYNIISGVTVTCGDQTLTTSLNGVFTFNRVNSVDGRTVVEFKKDGYMSLTRSFPTTSEDKINVALTRIQTTQNYSTNTSSKPLMSMTSWSGNTPKTMTVELPTGAYKVGNSAYHGSVKAEAVYLNPDVETFAAQMPGDLTTNNDGGQLVSLGMVAVELTGSNGEKLQLAEGQKAKLTFPVPNGAKETPATMPLWSFNEETGLWEKEGTATYDAGLKAYVGEVSHFSWHNLDYEMTRATLKVKVVDNAGNPVYDVPVDFDGQRVITTDKNGIAKCVVPSDTKLYVRVASESYGNYAADFSEGWANVDRTKEARLENITLGGREEKTVELKLTARAPIISGHVINEGSGSKVCTIYMSFGQMQETDRVVSDLNGAYLLYGPAGYKGNAKVIALFGDGTMAEKEFVMDGTDKTLDVTVNNSSSSGAGIVQVTGDGFKFNYNFPNPFSGSSYKHDNNLTIQVQDVSQEKMQSGDFDYHSMSFHYINVDIEDYDENKTDFDVIFNIGREGHGGGHMSLYCAERIKMNIVKSGYTWIFKTKGAKGNLYDQNRNIESADITFDAEFSATVMPSTERE